MDLQRGIFRVKGPDRLVSFSDVAKQSYLGVKGGSEAGNVGAPAAIVNAIIDALSPWGLTDMPMPATSDRVWRMINKSDVARERAEGFGLV